jgi:crotonobetainyl-CoA:carnitine CoA-transferase CaiB-like acyl-CoA transferase
MIDIATKGETAAPGALAGIRVIDFGQYLAGPLAALLLADCGADVVHVDPPGGPRWNHPANAFLQRNKSSIILDLQSDEDRAIANKLVDGADVVIEGFRPGVMARLGLSAKECCHRNGRLVWCSLPGFGHDDPRSQMQGWEGIVSAAAGLYLPKLFTTTGGPRFSAIPHASNFAGMIAAHSIVAALIARERDGRGDQIEVPLFDAAFEAHGAFAESPPSIDLSALATASGFANPAVADRLLYKGRDGRLVWRGSPYKGFHRLWDEYLPTELKQKTDEDSVRITAAAIAKTFEQRDALEWERIGQEQFGAAVAVTQSSEDWLKDDHALSSHTVLEVVDPELGPTKQAGFGFEMSETPPVLRFARHLPDEDGAAVREELDERWTPSETVGEADDSNTARPPPLEGIRVVDFSILLAGPGACRVLAEYGADVVKVNKSSVGWGNFEALSDDFMMFIGHRTASAGKRTILVDLKSEAGRDIAQLLVDRSDVVHHNFTPDAAARLGLGEDQVRDGRPEVVYSKVSLHARGGWRESYRGHEDHSQAVTGASVRFAPASPECSPVAFSDNGTAHLSALAILVGLFHRSRTGRGQRVDAALSRSATLEQSPFMIAFEGQEHDEPAGPEATGWSSLDRLYQAADGWFYLADRSEDARSRLAKTDGLHDVAELDDIELESVLSDRFRTSGVKDWVDRLNDVGVCAHVYRDMETLWDDPVVVERGTIIELDHPGLGRGREVGIVARFASMPDRTVEPAARPGWHSRAILLELGYSER